jgi:OOP family OmpA-OmpF porin
MRHLLLLALLALSFHGIAAPTSEPTSAPARKIVISKGSIEIVVLGPMLFEENSDTLTQGTTSALDIIAKTLIDMPNITLIEVQGYADPSTEKQQAKDLANRRAKAAKAYLTTKGVSPKRIRAKGYAATKPVSTTEQIPNRRIEVVLKKTK